MDKKLYYINGKQQFTIKKLTISFGNSNCNILITKSDVNHICDLIFTSSQDKDGYLFRVCNENDEKILVNGVSIVKMIKLSPYDTIQIRDEKFMYFEGQLSENWKERTSLQRKKSMSEINADNKLPNCMEIKECDSVEFNDYDKTVIDFN